MCLDVVAILLLIDMDIFSAGGGAQQTQAAVQLCRTSPQWGPDLPFFGHADHGDPLAGWRCCSQKRVMSRPIQVRQL